MAIGCRMRFLLCSVLGLVFVLSGLAGPALHAQDLDQRYRLLELGGMPVKWGKPRFGTAVSVSYRLIQKSSTFADARNCRGMDTIDDLLESSGLAPADFLAALDAAFAMWEAAAGIEFVPAKDGSRADLLIGTQSTPAGIAYADVLPVLGLDGEVHPLQRGLICLNPGFTWIGVSRRDGPADFDLRLALAHEIGHAIGLDHPGPRGTLMSFMLGAQKGGLRPGDIAGAMRLYGPPSQLVSEASDSETTALSN